MARKPKHEEHVNHERWLISYADFITLLFAVFTALYAISNQDKDKFEMMARSLRSAFSGGKSADTRGSIGNWGKTKGSNSKGGSSVANPFSNRGARRRSVGAARIGAANPTPPPSETIPFPDPWALPASDPQTTATPPPVNGDEGSDSEREGTKDGGDGGTGWDEGLKDRIMKSINFRQSEQMIVDFRPDKRGMVISLSADDFFEPESALVKADAKFKLERIIQVLQEMKDHDVVVEGHTDDTKLTKGLHSSLLELSCMRASNLVEFMVKQFDFPAARISCGGYGDARPIADNSTEYGRRLNRRVDIRVLDSEVSLGSKYKKP